MITEIATGTIALGAAIATAWLKHMVTAQAKRFDDRDIAIAEMQGAMRNTNEKAESMQDAIKELRTDTGKRIADLEKKLDGSVGELDRIFNESLINLTATIHEFKGSVEADMRNQKEQTGRLIETNSRLSSQIMDMASKLPQQ